MLVRLVLVHLKQQGDPQTRRRGNGGKGGGGGGIIKKKMFYVKQKCGKHSSTFSSEPARSRMDPHHLLS